MYASIPQSSASSSELFRWFARASSIVLFMIWIVLLVQDLMGESQVTSQGTIQAAALAVVFTGFAIGWQKELAGSLIAACGTIMFFAVCAITCGQIPGVAAAWFAFPALLYLLAWYSNKRHANTT